MPGRSRSQGNTPVSDVSDQGLARSHVLCGRSHRLCETAHLISSYVRLQRGVGSTKHLFSWLHCSVLTDPGGHCVLQILHTDLSLYFTAAKTRHARHLTAARYRILYLLVEIVENFAHANLSIPTVL
jgi:hypothetical protein